MDNYGAGIVADSEAWTRSIFEICNEFTTKLAGIRTSQNVQVIMNSLLRHKLPVFYRSAEVALKTVLYL